MSATISLPNSKSQVQERPVDLPSWVATLGIVASQIGPSAALAADLPKVPFRLNLNAAELKAAINHGQSKFVTIEEAIDRLRGYPTRPLAKDSLEWGEISISLSETSSTVSSSSAFQAYSLLFSRGAVIVPKLQDIPGNSIYSKDVQVAAVDLLAVLADGAMAPRFESLIRDPNVAPEVKSACLRGLELLVHPRIAEQFPDSVGQRVVYKLASEFLHGQLKLDTETTRELFSVLSGIPRLAGTTSPALELLHLKTLPLDFRVEAAANLALLASNGHFSPAAARTELTQLFTEAENLGERPAKLLLAMGMIGDRVTARLLQGLLEKEATQLNDLSIVAVTQALGLAEANQAVDTKDVIGTFSNLLGKNQLSSAVATQVLCSLIELEGEGGLENALELMRKHPKLESPLLNALLITAPSIHLREQSKELSDVISEYLVQLPGRPSPVPRAELLLTLKCTVEFPSVSSLETLRQIVKPGSTIAENNALDLKVEALRAMAAIAASSDEPVVSAALFRELRQIAGLPDKSDLARIVRKGNSTKSQSAEFRAPNPLAKSAVEALLENHQEVPLAVLQGMVSSIDLAHDSALHTIRAFGAHLHPLSVSSLSAIAFNEAAPMHVREVAIETIGKIYLDHSSDTLSLGSVPVKTVSDTAASAAAKVLEDISRGPYENLAVRALSTLVFSENVTPDQIKRLIAHTENERTREMAVDSLMQSPATEATKFIFSALEQVHFSAIRSDIDKVLSQRSSPEDNSDVSEVAYFVKKLRNLGQHWPERSKDLDNYAQALEIAESLGITHVAAVPAMHLPELMRIRKSGAQLGKDNVALFMASEDSVHACATICYGIHQLMEKGIALHLFEISLDDPDPTVQKSGPAQSYSEGLFSATTLAGSKEIRQLEAVIVTTHHNHLGAELSRSLNHSRSEQDRRSLDSSDFPVLNRGADRLRESGTFLLIGCDTAGEPLLESLDSTQPASLIEVVKLAHPKARVIGALGTAEFGQFTFDNQNKLSGVVFSVPSKILE